MSAHQEAIRRELQDQADEIERTFGETVAVVQRMRTAEEYAQEFRKAIKELEAKYSPHA